MDVNAQDINPVKVDASLCDSIRCGAYPDYSKVPGGVATTMACSQAFGASALGQCDSRCRPYWNLIAQNNPSLNPAAQCGPKPVAIAAPTMGSPSPAATPPAPITLTTSNIVPSIPDITRALEPVPVPVQKCSVWCDLNAGISEHPLMAVAVLVAAAILIGGRRG